jgi:hypothetical protein
MPLPSDAATRRAPPDLRRTWVGGILLASLVAALTLLAVRYGIRFSGFGALMVTFIGFAWLSIRVLGGRWSRFDRHRAATRNPPAA